MSAALKSWPANQSPLASSASMKASCDSMFGLMKALVTWAAIFRVMGLTKKGTGAEATLSNTSFISSGGIAEPSAKCSQ
jgi:hypothetical protein